MRILSFVALAVIAVVCVCAFMFIQTGTVRTLEQLGIPSDAVKECVWSSFRGGYLSYPSVAKLKQIAVGQRTGVLREVVDFAKSYTQTEEFKKKYLEYRDGEKPTPPDAPK